MSNVSFEDIIISPAPDQVDSSDIILDSSTINPSESTTFSPIPSEKNNIMQLQYVDNQTVLKQMLPTDKGPVGNYYAEINWNNGFESWDIVRFSTPMDGSCLFHAISNAFFTPYHDEMLHGKHISRDKIITHFRYELSQGLSSKISDAKDSPSHYEILSGGNITNFSRDVPEFKLEYMQAQLNSHRSIGYGYMEFIGNAINKDIYILEAIRGDIYNTDELRYTIKGNRNSIVLYYMNGHYELVGIQNKNGSFDTHFKPDHSFIKFLYSRVQQLL